MQPRRRLGPPRISPLTAQRSLADRAEARAEAVEAERDRLIAERDRIMAERDEL